MKQTFTVCAFGIIFDAEGKILLCHECDYDLWELPGGWLEQGESPWNSLKRSIKNKTGLDVEVVRLAGVYDKSERDEIAFCFVCAVFGGELRANNNDVDKVSFFESGNLPHNIQPKHRERINDAMEHPTTTVYKTQAEESFVDMIREGKL